jgi:hypothetical protein
VCSPKNCPTSSSSLADTERVRKKRSFKRSEHVPPRAIERFTCSEKKGLIKIKGRLHYPEQLARIGIFLYLFQSAFFSIASSYYFY